MHESRIGAFLKTNTCISLVAASLICLSLVFPFSSGPLVTFHLEWFAALGWLVVGVAYFACSGTVRKDASLDLKLLLLVPGSLAAVAVADYVSGRVAYTGQIALWLLYFLSAMAAAWLGWQMLSTLRLQGESKDSIKAFRRATAKTCNWLLFTFVVAALLNGVAGLLQHFGVAAPAWLVAPLQAGSRVYGNQRQANLFALVMVLGVVAVMALIHVASTSTNDRIPYKKKKAALWVAAGFFGLMVAYSLSRTGAVMLWALLAGACAGKGLTRDSRVAPLTAVAVHLIGWGLLSFLDSSGLHSYKIMSSVQVVPGSGNFTSFRSEIWAGMLAVVADHPFVGVGSGNAAYAYFMKDLPVRIDLNMQHAHNLPLQIAVQSGVVFCALWLLLVGAVLWRARAAWSTVEGRILGLALLAFAIHSNLEYPLWYLYFLLPCAFAFGGFVAMGSVGTYAPEIATHAHASKLVPVAVGVAALIVAVGLDYQRILPTFRSATHEQAMQNLQHGYGTWLFTQHMDYAVISNIPVTPQNARTQYNLTKRLIRVVIQPFILTNLALASSMIGKPEEAAFYLQRVGAMSLTGVQQVVNSLTPAEREVLQPAIQLLQSGKPAQ